MHRNFAGHQPGGDHVLFARAYHREREQAEHDAARRRQLGNGGRGNKVRTYNVIESRVVDHRLGVRTRNVKEVMRGRLDLLFAGERDED